MLLFYMLGPLALGDAEQSSYHDMASTALTVTHLIAELSKTNVCCHIVAQHDAAVNHC